ncbi:UDP-3-O-acyl-N-acetylglucosamine deacetylase [Ponticaulis profundi]|uniref:UDP-3-O-acyl-N-acetylglucosamine deacetylase n=1 Tax=Ponticaulis profundi TaxID=2665222 RepID=A0ABW1S5F3_9PROT
MTTIAYQHTIDSTAICAGVGVHSGERARLTLKPAAAGTGIVFQRVDVPREQGRIEARGDLVHDVTLGTKLRNEFGTTLSTVEHLLAAVYGLGVDNLVIEVDGPEVPIMDGSSELYADLIRQTGLRRQKSLRQFVRVLEPIVVEDGPKKAALMPVEDEGFYLDATIDFTTSAIGRQRKVMELTEKSFSRELAFARTFGFMSEIRQLHAMGLGQGASLENAIAVEDDKIVNPEGLRAKDEFVRHKLLDAVGDLSLIGHRVIGRYVSEQPGHSINNLLVRKLLKETDKWVMETAPVETASYQPEAMAACL